MSQLKVILKKSPINQKERQKRTLRALGLKKIGSSRIHKDTPVIRGMIEKVRHLVVVEEV